MGLADVLKETDALLEGEVRKPLDPGKYDTVPKAVQQWMDSWPAQDSYTDFLRASQLHNLCPREFVLNYWQPKANKNFDWKSYLMMSMGTHLHDYLQNQVLGPMGVLYGTWVNVKAEAGASKEEAPVVRHEGYYPDPDLALFEMQRQLPLTWRYEEPGVWSEKYRIRGHLDGLIDTDRLAYFRENEKLFKADPAKMVVRVRSIMGKKTLFEIKTTGAYVFESLKEPNDIAEYYKTQASIYQTLAGYPDTLFWYINRDTMASKTLVYPLDSGWWNDAKRKARIIWEAIRDETLPDLGMKCHTPKDKRAKECVHCPACFGAGKFADYVKVGKERAEKEGRKLLDLSGWTRDE